MGPMVALGGGLITAAACALFGYPVWLLVSLGVGWFVGVGWCAVAGHRMFRTGANSDLMIAIAGLGVTLSFVVPRALTAHGLAKPTAEASHLDGGA
jgi:hypothetical protein